MESLVELFLADELRWGIVQIGSVGFWRRRAKTRRSAILKTDVSSKSVGRRRTRFKWLRMTGRR